MAKRPYDPLTVVEMKARFGRDIYCQRCGKDDKIEEVWRDQFSYYYFCTRCKVKVKEIDHSNRRSLSSVKSHSSSDEKNQKEVRREWRKQN